MSETPITEQTEPDQREVSTGVAVDAKPETKLETTAETKLETSAAINGVPRTPGRGGAGGPASPRPVTTRNQPRGRGPGTGSGYGGLSKFSVVTFDYAALPLKRAVATMLFVDSTGRVLVVKPTYKPGWELPGGSVEDGESPATAATREVDEELGLRRSPGCLLAVDYVPAGGRRTEGLVVVFDGGVIENPAEIRLRAEELSDSAFVDPEQLGSYLPTLQTRRAVASLRARTSGQAVYLEDGLPLAT